MPAVYGKSMRQLLALLAISLVLSAQAARGVSEFTLFKRPQATQVGEIGLILKGTDVKKQRFSVDLVVDGHTIEKRDLDIKIPLYIYVGTDAQPHELVVNKVGADQIEGRISSPK
jgi:hypothetical protein